MTEYKHRMTLAVPEQYIDIANQLALVVGEFPADVNTFRQANWQDKDGNKYAVCSAVSKPIVLSALTKGLPNPVPAHAVDADVELAQKALDSLEVYEDGILPNSSKIVMAVDIPPLEYLTLIGLSLVEESGLEP